MTRTLADRRAPWAGPRRSGLSLLEVLLALALFGGAMAALGELIRIGSVSGAAARDQVTAQLHAESKLAEVTAGILPLENVVQAPLGDDGEWLYSIVTEPTAQDALLGVTVLVEQDPQVVRRPISYTLTRWMLDPSVRAELESLAAEELAVAQQRMQEAKSSGQLAGGAAAAVAGQAADLLGGGMLGGLGGAAAGGNGAGGQGGPGGGFGGPSQGGGFGGPGQGGGPGGGFGGPGRGGGFGGGRGGGGFGGGGRGGGGPAGGGRGQ